MSSIRPAHPADLDRLLDLWLALMRNGQATDPRFHVASGARRAIEAWAAENWFRLDPFPRVIVAAEGDELCGFVHGFPVAMVPVLDVPATARVADLWVAPTMRRRGLGKTLVETFIANARKAGFPRLEVTTLSDDARARAFWWALGFADWQVTLLRG